MRMRWLGLVTLLASATAACDPVWEIDATITVPVETQTGLGLPAQLLVRDDREISAGCAYRIGVLCEETGQPFVATWSEDGVCGVETKVTAWVAPLTIPEASSAGCGAVAPDRQQCLEAPATPDAGLRAAAVAFEGATGSNCGEGTTRLTLVLSE
jgi:hypothetical protein